MKYSRPDQRQYEYSSIFVQNNRRRNVHHDLENVCDPRGKSSYKRLHAFHFIFRARSRNFVKRLSASATCLDIRLSALNNSAPTGRIFIKFGICGLLGNLSSNIQVSLKSNKNNGHFRWTMMYIYDISVNTSENEKGFRQKLQKNSKQHILYLDVFLTVHHELTIY